MIRAAAQEPSVERIFVNAAIKKALCREAKGDRSWLYKVRPMWGHDYHFHVRIKCPPGSGECESQPEPTEGEGCGAGDLAFWFSDSVLHPKPPKVPPKPRPPMTLAELPAACKAVLGRAGRQTVIVDRADPLRRARNAVGFRASDVRAIVNPPDCRNGASACRNPPNTNVRVARASAATTHGAPQCFALPVI